MAKTATLLLTKENQESKTITSFKGFVKKALNADEFEPSEETIRNILNYSHALKIKRSDSIGNIEEIAN